MASKYINPIPISELDRGQLQSGLQELSKAHPICGVAVPGTSPLLLIRQPQSRANWNGVIPFRNVGFFGASMNFVATFDDGSATLVTVPRTHPAFDGLSGDRICLAFIHGGKVQAAADLDESLFASIRNDVVEHKAVLPDVAAHFWEMLACCHAERSKYPLRLSSNDRLAIGWANRCREEIQRVRAFHETLAKCSFGPSSEQSHPVRTLVKILRDSASEVTTLFHMFDKFIGESFSLLREVQSRWDIPIDTSEIPEEYRSEFNEVWKTVPQSLWDTYLFLPKFTDYGRQVAWLDTRENSVQALRIDPANFPEGFAPEDYWLRVPHGNRTDWGRLVSGSDIYIALEMMENGWQEFAGAADPVQALECAGQLFDEAVANKRGTIPSHAVVELRFGPFTHMELVENGHNVFGVLRTETSDFYEIYMVPSQHFCSFGLSDIVSDERLAAIEGGVILLLAAIVRDFWVVEEREKVFGTRPAGPRDFGKAPGDAPRIVYLPRVHYQERPNAGHCAETLGLQERRAHFVSPHRRRLLSGRSASDHQRILASMYGFNLQDGYTFVGPHERGKVKRETIYRSRSALRSLYRESTSASGEPIQWFQFERDVYKLMESLGFDVEHIAASKRGDNGIDIYARKGSDFDEVNWVIQCKCWHPKRKVSPNIVRELIGVLSGYPQGTRGMIVATCGFSPGALEAATTANIRTVDGAEFVTLAGKVKSGGSSIASQEG